MAVRNRGVTTIELDIDGMAQQAQVHGLTETRESHYIRLGRIVFGIGTIRDVGLKGFADS